MPIGHELVNAQRQERKVVTVLFCDLVGFTSRAEEMDPEDVASLLGPYHARLKEELERYGGTVEKFIGDAVMAVFGAPIAHEDDPERAVRAALVIRDFAEDTGIELRIGVTTGEALVTLDARPEQGESMATGDVVNTAARLQAAAPVNGILASEKTYQATKSAIEYGQADPLAAKGKAKPVVVWEALRPRARATLDRLHGSPLVGRSRELDQVVDALARSRAERQPQLVTVVGVPGIGKSRLVYELSQAVDREPELISWRQGRCLPYGDGVTFWALGEIVKAQAGILEGDTADVADVKLREAVTDEWVRSHLRPLVGLTVDAVGEGDRREEAFTAWRRFFEGIAAERPLVFVLEDLHWADENLLDFVDHLVDWASGVPMLVVCTARPELLERRPGWGGGKTNALTISLSPLSDEETARLIAELLEQALMPAETQAALLARAGGNPLYAEQYVRMLRERTADELPLPENVQGIIAARLDGLEPEQKSLVQDAAAVGKAFWLGAVCAISGLESRPAETRLHALERKGFVRRERESSIEGDTEYAFLHILVREVAYGQIPRAARAHKHRLAAEWIESLGRPEDHAEMLVYHYGEALALARAAGVGIESIAEPARRVLRAAGDRALALHAYAAAVRFYEQALDLWPAADPDRARLLFDRARAHFLAGGEAAVDLLEEAKRALLDQGDREAAAEAGTFEAMALWNVGRRQNEVVLDRASSAAALLEGAPTSSTKAYVVANLARYLVLTGRYEDAMRIGRQALAMADELALGELRGNALNTIGMARMSFGDFAGIDDLEESLRLALEHGSPIEISRTYNNLGVMSLIAGRVDRASEVFSSRLELEERFGMSRSFGEAVMAQHAYWTGRWDDAARLVDALVSDESPLSAWELLRSVRAMVRLARDDLLGADEDSARTLEALGEGWSAGAGQGIEAQCACAQVLHALGRTAEADHLVERILALAWVPPYGYGGVVELPFLLRTLDRPVDPVVQAAEEHPAHPWLQAAAAVARGELDSAADQLAELRCPPLESYVRLRAAERLVAEGRRVEADAQLQRALAFWRSVGATRYIREGEALLAATA
jgi:class 3 adenylate cyclase/tetratricopeptide (TPR) repeat protein